MKIYLLTILYLLTCGFYSYGQTYNLPYYNSFDNLPSDTLDWSHYAISGSDDWQVGIPSYSNFNSAFSPYNVWCSNLTGNYSSYSNRALETPFFNLIDTTSHKVLSFYHKIYYNSSTSQNFYIEYKIGSSGSWQLLNNSAMQKKNWQSTTGFTFSNSSNYYNSAIDLFFLQGQDSVKFRFRFNSTTSGTDGWMIDNFSLKTVYNNVIAVQGDTINNINQNFNSFTLVSDYIFSNQFSTVYSFTDNFYFSTDNILDINDSLIGTVTHSASQSITNWSNTFPMPLNLSSGDYYIFYKYDVNNVLSEDNENDNVNFAVLHLDPLITSNYADDFDTTVYLWNLNAGTNTSNWHKGDADNWHVENPRSGEYGWYSGLEESGKNYLYTPYLDLSQTTNNSICFWYKTAANSATPFFYLQKPYIDTNYLIAPQFTTAVNSASYNKRIKPTRYYGWDCFCESVSGYDGLKSTQFRIYAYGTGVNSNNQNQLLLSDQILIDDIYIGEEKPDVGIGGESNNRFTDSLQTFDTLTYTLFNSGLATLPATNTVFYWSADSILDVSDILLGTQLEPSIPDTSYIVRQFFYSKPTINVGDYYIIYQLDESDSVDEMREYDNIGFFHFKQTLKPVLPYFNDFETNIDGWRHASSLGDDQWEWASPTGVVIDTAFSGQKALITNASGAVASHSRMHLYSPVFDLSQLQNPVVEFDLFVNYFYNNGYYFNMNQANIMYSVDGGNSWQILKTSLDNSFERWYSTIKFSTISGEDYITQNPTPYSSILYNRPNTMLKDYYTYTGRDYDNNEHYVLDLFPLRSYKNIQFMFVYANENIPSEGVMLDNFNIRESANDLMVPAVRKLMVSSDDVELKTFFEVKNNDNYKTDSTVIELYLSTDSIIDSTDYLIKTESIPVIAPYAKHFINIVEPVPLNYGQYNYLIYNIDPTNNILESNESNNTGFFDLSMDSAANYIYPVEYDFEQDEIDGWTWWHDSSGIYNGHRFRHKLLPVDVINEGQSGEWFLEHIDQSNYGHPYTRFPTFHLEPPAFDFSQYTTVFMSFDFRCVGTNLGSSQGGNLSYSLDGGATWIVLTNVNDPYAQNWYQVNSVTSLNGEPGWVNYPDWTTATYDLTFLAGEPDVRFRFNWRAKYIPNSSSVQGFRLDNFKIDAFVNDLIASDIHPTISFDLNQPSFPIIYQIENTGASDIINSSTGFFWSTDSILDSGDLELYNLSESLIPAASILIDTQYIYYPSSLLNLSDYYVIYFTDADSVFNEPNELNNYGWWKVHFADSFYIDIMPESDIDYVNTDIYSDWFYFHFNSKNIGNLQSDSSKVNLYWSENQVLDSFDVLLYSISETEILPDEWVTHAGNIYFPYSIDQSPYYLIIYSDPENVIFESNESNNTLIIPVNIDMTGLSIDENSELSNNYKLADLQDGKYNLLFNGGDNNIISIKVFDSMGSVLIDIAESPISLDNPVFLDLSSFSNGLYFVCLMSDNQNVNFKIVKQ